MGRIISCVVTAVMFTALISCSKTENGNGIPDDNFDVPALTESNTIQFTVNASASPHASVILFGGKVAVDWGDGTVNRRYDPERGEVGRSEFRHSYAKGGEYRVKIWSDEVTFIRLSGLLKDYRDVRVGNCPVLKNAVFNTITKGKAIDINGCPKIEELEISNFKELESVNLDKCINLYVMSFYTNPEVSALDLGSNNKLSKFYGSYCDLGQLDLPKSVAELTLWNIKGLESLVLNGYTQLVFLDCSSNGQLTSIDLAGCDNLRTLNFSKTSVASFDFSILPELRVVACNQVAGITGVNVGENTKLYQLSCSGNELTDLDLSSNVNLTTLDCSENLLESLDISGSQYMDKLYINNNEFGKEALEAIFTSLPQRRAGQMPPVIKYLGNPGSDEADKQILIGKEWFISSL